MASTPVSRAKKNKIEADFAPAKLHLVQRPRRLRQNEWTRRLVRENVVTTNDLIWPIFIIDGKNRREAVASMPLVERLTAADPAAHGPRLHPSARAPTDGKPCRF